MGMAVAVCGAPDGFDWNTMTSSEQNALDDILRDLAGPSNRQNDLGFGRFEL